MESLDELYVQDFIRWQEGREEQTSEGKAVDTTGAEEMYKGLIDYCIQLNCPIPAGIQRTDELKNVLRRLKEEAQKIGEDHENVPAHITVSQNTLAIAEAAQKRLQWIFSQQYNESNKGRKRGGKKI